MPPLADGSSQDDVSANISELHTGKTYARTRLKYGAKVAQRQTVAIALNKAGKAKKAWGMPKKMGTKL